MSIATAPDTTVTACSKNASLFQHPLLEEATSGLSSDARRQQQFLARKAENLCLECPLMTQCLFQAVVQHDVAGYVAGTTQRQRTEMRNLLGVRVQPEDFDTLAGVTAPNRQVDHDEVVRLRNANPYESLDTIAQRLGCSLSTVKRHLRKARNSEPKPALAAVAPSLEQVLQAYRVVSSRPRRGSAVRAA